ncbi:Uma2 family endonuclease [Streptomyces sp. CA-253872]|uniref:Uma2 family endonuclease n=1 Tax=Streptomyces sp. CA-253872 TaxID=3240067 RepID=UPI003D8F7ED0
MGALMSIDPIEPPAARNAWPVPPRGGWTADDLDTLPDLPPHTELIDGSLVFMSPQTRFHVWAVDFFNRHLVDALPEGLDVLREFTIDIDEQNRPEPDVIVFRTDGVEEHTDTRLPASSVLLAVEVVSRESLTRDRETKPLKYARAGIPHYWRVEDTGDHAVVYTFEREPATGAYVSTGIFHERMKVTEPFALDLDLGRIMRNRRGKPSES